MRFWLPTLCAIAMAHAGDPPGWKLAWSDEFNRDGAPDPAKWSYEKGFVRNGERQYYTVDRRKNCRVAGGRLILEARREKLGKAEYTSASITTRNKASWKRGRFEVRAKVPAGRGTWPAAWLLGNAIDTVGWPRCGEIDIMEFVGFDPDATHCAVHCEKYNHARNTGRGTKIPGVNPSAEFRLYALEWHHDRLDFFVDDRKVYTFPKGDDPAAWPFDQPHFLILNLAIGGGWGGKKGIDDALFPHRYEVDYVRVYRRG